jgi:hypothetical protein
MLHGHQIPIYQLSILFLYFLCHLNPIDCAFGPGPGGSSGGCQRPGPRRCMVAGEPRGVWMLHREKSMGKIWETRRKNRGRAWNFRKSYENLKHHLVEKGWTAGDKDGKTASLNQEIKWTWGKIELQSCTLALSGIFAGVIQETLQDLYRRQKWSTQDDRRFFCRLHSLQISVQSWGVQFSGSLLVWAVYASTFCLLWIKHG